MSKMHNAAKFRPGPLGQTADNTSERVQPGLTQKNSAVLETKVVTTRIQQAQAAIFLIVFN
jgi:hypothetical protein